MTSQSAYIASIAEIKTWASRAQVGDVLPDQFRDLDYPHTVCGETHERTVSTVLSWRDLRLDAHLAVRGMYI